MKILIIILTMFCVSCSESVVNKKDYDEAPDPDIEETDEDIEQNKSDEEKICNVLEEVAKDYINIDGENGKAIGSIVRIESPEISKTCLFGSKVKGEAVPLSGSEQWVIGSVSKMLTSFILSNRAVDDEKIISEHVKNYLPVNWVIPVGSGDEKITLTHLMTHTSGLPHYPKTLQESIDNVKSFDDLYAAWENYTIDDLESDLNETVLSFDPGSEYLYSDFGFALVQKVAEELYGKNFPKILEDFSQLMGLKNTVVPEHLSNEQKNNLFYGHGGALMVPMAEPVVTPVFTGDGFIYSDAEDLGRLLRIFAGIDNVPNDEVAKATEIIEEEHFVRDAGGVQIAQGFGIGIITEGDFTIYKKNGTSAGTTTAFLWDKENNIGLSVAGNVIPFSEGVNGFICDIYYLLYLDRTGKVLPDDVYEACRIPF